MSRYRVSPAAQEDLKQISRFITLEQQSPQGAKRLRGLFVESFCQLARNPYLGAACPEFGEHLRITSVGSYIVFYEPRANGIDILQIAHGARDLPAIVRTRMEAETRREEPAG